MTKDIKEEAYLWQKDFEDNFIPLKCEECGLKWDIKDEVDSIEETGLCTGCK